MVKRMNINGKFSIAILFIVGVIVITGIALVLFASNKTSKIGVQNILVNAAGKSSTSDSSSSIEKLQGISLDKVFFQTNAEKEEVKKALDRAFVSQGYILVPWRKLEPSPGQYDWSFLDERLNLMPPGKPAQIGVGTGRSAPDWIYSAGAKPVHCIDARDRANTIPAPTDAIFLKHWTQFIQEFGKRYDADPRISVIKITGIHCGTQEYGRLDVEGNAKEFLDAGVTAKDIIAANEQIMTAFKLAFPHKYFALQMTAGGFAFIKKGDPNYNPSSWGVDYKIPWGWGNELWRATMSQGATIFGKRFIMQNNGLVGDMTTRSGHKAVLDGMKKYNELGGITAWQMGWSAVKQNPEHPMGNGTPADNLRDALNFGLSTKPLFIEVYAQDLNSDDAQIQNMLQDANNNMVGIKD